jgi:hypothetical protein
MKSIGGLFFAGVLIIAATKFFQFQTKIGDNVIGRVKSRDPEQIAIASALIVGLGLTAVVVGQAFRKAAR